MKPVTLVILFAIGIAVTLLAQNIVSIEVPAQSFYREYPVEESRAPRYDGQGLNMEVLTDERVVVISRFLYKSPYTTNWIYNTNRIVKPIKTLVKYYKATSTPAGTVWAESDGVGVEFLTLPSPLSPR